MDCGGGHSVDLPLHRSIALRAPSRSYRVEAPPVPGGTTNRDAARNARAPSGQERPMGQVRINLLVSRAPFLHFAATPKSAASGQNRTIEMRRWRVDESWKLWLLQSRLAPATDACECLVVS